MKERISKIISRLGYTSRRKAEQLIFDGKVFIDGVKIDKPQEQYDPSQIEITIEGKKLCTAAEEGYYYALNKPKGYICSSIGSKTVLSFFSDTKIAKRLFTIGRLDKDTTGLILVTNDGSFAHRVMHPSFQVEKEYLVKVREEVDDRHLKAISKGTYVETCYVIPKKVVKVRRGTLKITLLDGKKHEVRELVANAKLNILELCRIRIGPLRLNDLLLGAYRQLTPKEIALFRNYSSSSSSDSSSLSSSSSCSSDVCSSP